MKTARFPEETLVMLTTSPAGLGHIRVMEALRAGLDTATRVVDLGIDDRAMKTVHRLSSVNPGLRALMEMIQNNPLIEGGFSRVYRQILAKNPQDLKAEIINTLRVEKKAIHRLVMVCTHFGIGHQAAAIKKSLAAELGLEVTVAVVVTDDSPQEMWAVIGADFLFVPSESTRAALEVILEKLPGIKPEIVVTPYPLSPALAEKLTLKQLADRQNQLLGKAQHPLIIMLPISGAAVQLSFYQELIQALPQLISCLFVIVSRESGHTNNFLEWCRLQKKVSVLANQDDREVVQLYKEAYSQEIIGVEVTKPSEQLFKVLLTPEQVGGSVLLFSEAVGRQEDDNLLFLNRHELIPSLKQQEELKGEVGSELKAGAKKWRGLKIPAQGNQAAIFIAKMQKQGILAKMGEFDGFMEGHEELADNGVEKIWRLLNN